MYKRLFIAIKISPTEEFLSRIYYLKNNLSEDNINWIKESHYHLTLKFLGKTHIHALPNLKNRLSDIADRFKSFDFDLYDLGVFGSKYQPRVLWFGIDHPDAIIAVNNRIVDQLKDLGYASDRQNFVPHLTVARIRKIVNKDHFQAVVAKFKQGLIQNQKVSEMILYESVLKQSGAEYHIVDRFAFK